MNEDMDYLEYKGYKGSVEYSKEDDCPPFPGCRGCVFIGHNNQ